MVRNIATPAQYRVKVTGTAGATIEYGFLVSTEDELNFYCTEGTVIGEDGTGEIVVECVESGTIGNVPPESINRIVNTVASVESVEGTVIVKAGEDEESDYDFIKRYKLVREGKGSCTAASIVSAITNIPTVRGAYVTANESATETINGIPPKTIACYVDGGENHEQEIGEAIFDKKPIGIGTYGDKSVFVSYGSLNDYKVNFSYAKNVGVSVKIEITTNTAFGANGNVKIKDNITSFINSLEIGNPLIATTLYGQIYGVAGVVSAIAQISKDGQTYGENTIDVEPNERCVLERLTINGTVV